MALNLATTAVKSVVEYVAAPVTSCDRCSAGIKYVTLVTYKDGFAAKFGSECIRKVLAAVPDLKGLYLKNAKLLTTYRRYLEILTGPAEAMPYGREYFGSGLYFIGDGNGRDVFFNDHWFFHPAPDWAKNADSERPVIDPDKTVKEWQTEAARRDIPKLRTEIARIELFLARVLSKAGAVEAAKLAAVIDAAAPGEQTSLF